MTLQPVTTEESTPFLPDLGSSRTIDTEPDMRLPLRGDPYSLILSKLLPQFVISADVVLPIQGTSNETVPVGETSVAAISTHAQREQAGESEESTLFFEQLSEYDIVVNMSPKRSYAVTLKVESVSRADPNIVEPDWNWTES